MGQCSSTRIPSNLDIKSFDNTTVPRGGVRLSFLREFVSNPFWSPYRFGSYNFKGKTTTNVCEDIVKSLTKQYECSLCDLLKALNHSAYVEKADVFVSHAWKYTFLDVVDILEHHFEGNPDVVIWFDLFCNNQHQTTELNFDWWAGTFKTAIKDFNHTVMILMPWRDPIPLQRCWCLYELYCSYEKDCRFEVAMGKKGYREFVDAVENAKEGAVSVTNKMLATIDICKAGAFKQEDKEMILNAVRGTVGLTRLNGVVLSLMRDWVVQVYSSEYQRRVGLSGASHPDTLNSMNNLADIYGSQGKYDQAEPLYVECLDLRKAILGASHPDTLISMNNLAEI